MTIQFKLQVHKSFKKVVTHQWSGDHSIYWYLWEVFILCRNSPMIWWPFNQWCNGSTQGFDVVTHQWSGDHSINGTYSKHDCSRRRNSPMIWWPFNYGSLFSLSLRWDVVTHQWSGDHSINEHVNDVVFMCRNSPMIWWPFNFKINKPEIACCVVTHQWSGDHSIFSCHVSRYWMSRNSPMIWWPFN